MFQQSFAELITKKQVNYKSTYQLQTFKIIKYSKVNLDYQPRQIEFRDPFFILIYEKAQNGQVVPFIDIFNKSGLPIKRINIQNILESYQMSLNQISYVKIPILEWSARSNFA